MNSDKLASLVGMIANLGVLAGLVILIIQVDQANKLAEADTIQGRASEIQESLQQFALSDYLPAIYAKASEQGFDSLGRDEKARAEAWESARLFRMQGQYRQYRLGLLDQASAENMLQAAAWYSKNYWKPLGMPIADQDFVEALNKASPVKPPGAMDFHEKAANPR